MYKVFVVCALLAMTIGMGHTMKAIDESFSPGIVLADDQETVQLLVNKYSVEITTANRMVVDVESQAKTTTGCVCSSWQPSPTQEHPDRSMRICGAFPGPGGCIQERYCNYCAVWPDCGDCSL